jgi:hypothetical protein
MALRFVIHPTLRCRPEVSTRPTRRGHGTVVRVVGLPAASGVTFCDRRLVECMERASKEPANACPPLLRPTPEPARALAPAPRRCVARSQRRASSAHAGRPRAAAAHRPASGRSEPPWRARGVTRVRRRRQPRRRRFRKRDAATDNGTSNHAKAPFIPFRSQRMSRVLALVFLGMTFAHGAWAAATRFHGRG